MTTSQSNQKPLIRSGIESLWGNQILRNILKFFNYSHFWVWNALFCCLVITGIIPQVLPECTMSVISGEMPVGIYLSIIGLLSIPISSVVVGLKNYKNSNLLFRYFYGLEIPLMLLFSLRAFALKQNTFAASLYLGCCLITILYIGYVL